MIVIHLKKDVPTVIKSGKVEIDLAERIVKVKGKVVPMDEDEYLMALMMARSLCFDQYRLE